MEYGANELSDIDSRCDQLVASRVQVSKLGDIDQAEIYITTALMR